MRAWARGCWACVIAVSWVACASGSDASDPAGPDDVVEVSDDTTIDEGVKAADTAELTPTDPGPEEILPFDVTETALDVPDVGPEVEPALEVEEPAVEVAEPTPDPAEMVEPEIEEPGPEPVEVVDEAGEAGTETVAPQYPEVCLGIYEPSAPTCPVDLPAFNCCDTQNRLLRCVDGQLFCNDCVNGPQPPTNPKVCGWTSDALYYGCGYTDLAPDAAHPRACTF